LVAAGAVRGQLIGVALTERAKAIIAMLAVLKIGCAYLPLDPRDPRERNCGLLRDCKSNLVFTDPEYAAEFELGCARVLTLDAAIVLQDGENLDWDGSGSDAAYVMFTSGSTGRPKCVVVPHRAITRLVLNTNYVDIRSSDRIAQLSTLLFDAATFEIFGALLNGAALVIVPRDVAMSPVGFEEAVARQRVTIGFFTSSLFNHLVSLVPHAFHTFRCVLVGGEAVNPKWFARLFQSGYRGRLVNAYGPTESTTFSICNGLTAWESEVASVPIGRPISNTTAYVLDNSLNPVPPGVVGEICIGGDGLALGYLNDESATREKFVASRLVPGERLYRTGDLGRYRSDGDIECLGRIDRQLKIRGFRIEPHEIECVLKQHPAVRQAAVIAVGIESADRNLWAYVVLTPGASVSDTDLHNWLKSKLPAYLLPAAVILMDALPLTANGKLDHGKLPSPKLRERNRQGNRQVCTPMESLVLGAWGRILDIREISPEDNFFDLGGTSLLAVRMLLELERELARPIPVALILRWPTAEAFARALEIRPVTDLARLFCIREGNPQLRPIVLVHGGADYGHVLQFLTIENPIWTLSGPEEAEISETTNMEQLASLYLDDLRRAFPSHPPVVAGYCLSGMIGFEIARQFSRFHRDSGCIVLLDVPSPYYYWNLPRSKGLAEIASYFSYVGQLWRRLSAAQKFSLLWNSARRMYWRVKGGREDNVAVWEGLTERFLRAAHLYHPDPFLGKVVLLRASLRPKTDAYLGWRSFASQVMVIDTPSTHADVLSSAHARRAAEALISAANWVST
jgi:amino acid adenylation domain-containing protein